MANLLIGNGINRLGNYSQSWEQILQQLSEVTGETLNMDGKSYLHIYEEVYSKAAAKGKNEDYLRYKIVQCLSLIKQNNYHKQILNLPFENIFTTNYDYAFTPDLQRKNNERDYSLKRFQEINGKQVWHIHGELNSPASIMLGYDHYMKSIGKIQGHLKNKKNALKQGNESWVDSFLHDDLYIFGIGLDFNEIDLWWLLAYRNRGILEGRLPTTDFVYFDIIDNPKIYDKVEGSPKNSMLKAYKVKPENLHIDMPSSENYLNAYDKIINNLNILLRR